VTIDGTRSLKWYMCGPTVYAPSHMGHARTYLGFDIIRRILTYHFNYDVTLVMNITDLDDKIIERAHEQSISCAELSQQFEAEFHEDMEMLHVAKPSVLTRVTEYMEEITTYIDTIVQKGLAYESNGSVYFAVEEFGKQEGMSYAKLEPEQVNNTELLAEGEGKLTQDFVDEKRSPKDFALWKKSKQPHEPRWPSKWGEGRPGWHIECSVMASQIFAQMAGYDCAEDILKETDGGPADPDACKMDIHSGGVDLKFPHHDNEMAQAEAHSGCCQWVNYFVHAGHLHIKGFKMSKSLKNFITIRQALENNTARQVRMCFLLHKYNAPMDYGDNTMSHAITTEKTFVEFFHNAKAVLREEKISDKQRWEKPDRDLQLAVELARVKVDEALKDDFDTPAAIGYLIDLVKATNLYLDGLHNHSQQPPRKPVSLVVRNAAKFITKIFRTFGIIPDSAGGEIGFPIQTTNADGSSSSGAGGQEEILTPILDALIDFRSSVRDKARAKDVGGVLDECDAFRDDALPPLGIRLEDRAGKKAIWKLADAEELMKEREQKLLEKKRKEEEKKAAEEEKRKKDEVNRLTPGEFMRKLTVDEGDDKGKLKYSEFDDAGMPTKFHNGEDLSKAQKKKATKEFKSQKKNYEKYIKNAEKKDSPKKKTNEKDTVEKKDNSKKETNKKEKDTVKETIKATVTDTVTIQKTERFTVIEAPGSVMQ